MSEGRLNEIMYTIRLALARHANNLDDRGMQEEAKEVDKQFKELYRFVYDSCLLGIGGEGSHIED